MLLSRRRRGPHVHFKLFGIEVDFELLSFPHLIPLLFLVVAIGWFAMATPANRDRPSDPVAGLFVVLRTLTGAIETPVGRPVAVPHAPQADAPRRMAVQLPLGLPLKELMDRLPWEGDEPAAIPSPHGIMIIDRTPLGAPAVLDLPERKPASLTRRFRVRLADAGTQTTSVAISLRRRPGTAGDEDTLRKLSPGASGLVAEGEECAVTIRSTGDLAAPDQVIPWIKVRVGGDIGWVSGLFIEEATDGVHVALPRMAPRPDCRAVPL